MSEVQVTRPMTAEERKKKREKRQAQIGLASNVLGLSAATTALGSTLRDERLKGGGKVARGIHRLGEKVPAPIQSRLDEWAKDPAKKAKASRTAAALATGAVGLQAANLAGDVVANRVLNREAKKPVPIEKWDFGSGATVGTAISKRTVASVIPGSAATGKAPFWRKTADMTNDLLRQANKPKPATSSAGQASYAQGLRQQKQDAAQQAYTRSLQDKSKRLAQVKQARADRLAREGAESSTKSMQTNQPGLRANRGGNAPAPAAAPSTGQGMSNRNKVLTYGALGGAGAFGGYQLTKADIGELAAIAKRRYDPEADRQRNQGVVTGVSAAAAPAAAVGAARQFEVERHTSGERQGKVRGVRTKDPLPGTKKSGKPRMSRGGRAALLAAGSVAAGSAAAHSFKRGQSERNQPWT